MSTELRCEVTGNPCGTDTWARGHTCPCMQCQIFLLEPMTSEEICYLLQARGSVRKDDRCERCRVGRLVFIDDPAIPWSVMRGEFARQLDGGREVWPTHCTGCGAIGMVMLGKLVARGILAVAPNRDGHAGDERDA